MMREVLLPADARDAAVARARCERARDAAVLLHAVATGLLLLVLATLALLGIAGLARLDALAARLDALERSC